MTSAMQSMLPNQNQLGWTPTVTIEEGLRRTVEWYLTHDWWEPLLSEVPGVLPAGLCFVGCLKIISCYPSRLIITRTIAKTKQQLTRLRQKKMRHFQSVDQAQKFFGGFRIDLSAYATEEALSGI